mmetsp:Transcript_12894/g.51477  ORF Transcript_12894/g.51477 Transcript_12894/m.51477 type:complete len:258 (-) Transcript_12894:53-826(-)
MRKRHSSASKEDMPTALLQLAGISRRASHTPSMLVTWAVHCWRSSSSSSTRRRPATSHALTAASPRIPSWNTGRAEFSRRREETTESRAALRSSTRQHVREVPSTAESQRASMAGRRAVARFLSSVSVFFLLSAMVCATTKPMNRTALSRAIELLSSSNSFTVAAQSEPSATTVEGRSKARARRHSSSNLLTEASFSSASCSRRCACSCLRCNGCAPSAARAALARERAPSAPPLRSPAVAWRRCKVNSASATSLTS